MWVRSLQWRGKVGGQVDARHRYKLTDIGIEGEVDGRECITQNTEHTVPYMLPHHSFCDGGCLSVLTP
jgi:hypothetical protein